MNTFEYILCSMKTSVPFTESQRFSQWWLWLIMISINGILGWGCFQQLVQGQPFGDNPMPNEGLIAVGLGMLMLTLLMYGFRLDTRISAQGVEVRFFPLKLRYQLYPWEQISHSEVRQYAPFAEFGGWGIRYSMQGQGRALNVRGNMGLQLEFTNGKKLLIGTQKPNVVREVIEHYKLH